VSFFAISLYVKLMQMRDTAEYGAAWLSGGRFWMNSIHYVLFCQQEIYVFGGLLLATAVWQRCTPRAGMISYSVAWLLGLLVLPALSVIEVLGLAHFALFLTPLGPEELRMIGWTSHVVSAGHVLQLPQVTAGLFLVVALYHVAPPAVWLPRWRGWEGKPAPIAVVLLAGVVTGMVPKPVLVDALLGPHPLIWMVFGNRSEPNSETPEDMAITPAAFQTSAAGSHLTQSLLAPLLDPAQRVLRAVPGVSQNRKGATHLTVKQRPTNVLILALESTRAASLATYNPAATAGRDLLRWRDETVVFDNIYAPVPTSAHAIFSILYGVYPYLGPFWSTADKSVVADSMAQFFARAGYRTHFYITSDLNYDNIRSFAAPGFERVLDQNDWPGQEAYAALPWGRDDRLLIEEIKRFITANGKRPYFLFAMTSNPHHPYTVDHLPPELRGADPEAQPQQAYERLVEYDLRLLTELYGWMKHQGVAEHTLLLVLGDHGEAFGEHPGNFGHAAFIYEENVHIPCFILHPRRLGLPRHIPQLGSQVDLRATILDILGMHESDPGDGVSLLREDPEHMVANFTENGVSRFGVRDTQFTYIYTPHVEAEQVFNRRADPGETQDVAASEPAVVARYRARLQHWEAQHQLSLAKVLR